jgi:protein-disulfide isomerase
MTSLKALTAILLAVSSSKLTTCRSPGEGGGDTSNQARPAQTVELKGVDTSALTARERSDWSSYVSELYSPCRDQPVSVAQCVKESRPCKACLPAASFLLEEVRRGRTRSQVEASFKTRFAADAVKNVELGNAPSKGAPSAPIVVVEFADFECPGCGLMRPVLDQLIEKQPNNVRLYFKHFPLSAHPNAEKAARAAIAAQNQGKFWEMHSALFDNQTQLDLANVEKLAEKIGLDMARFRKDRDSEVTAEAVARDRKQGETLDLKSTPTIFINGRHFQPGPDVEQDLEAWVKLELELLGQAPAPKTEPASSVAPAPSAAPAAASGVPSAAPAPAPAKSAR